MTENLTKYLPLALRIGVDKRLAFENYEKRVLPQSRSADFNKDKFLVDSKFSLALDEIV